MGYCGGPLFELRYYILRMFISSRRGLAHYKAPSVGYQQRVLNNRNIYICNSIGVLYPFKLWCGRLEWCWLNQLSPILLELRLKVA